MSAQITLNWEKDLTFETLLDGHKVTIDRDMENGGNDEGPPSQSPNARSLSRMQRHGRNPFVQQDEGTFRESIH